MMAAAAAALKGAQVSLLERNSVLGRKLALTGGGRCNLTNNTDINGLVQSIPGNGKFLYSVLTQFDSQSLQQFVRDELGLELVEEENGKIFLYKVPANSLCDAFRSFLEKHGVRILYNERASKLLFGKARINGVVTLKNTYRADAVIVCTGGVSYPATGSTGDGYSLARQAGHTVVRPRPALVPLEVQEQWPKALQGISLPDVRMTLKQYDMAVVGVQRGSIVFTHYGISGPSVLQLSRAVLPAAPPYQLSVNLFPDLNTPDLTNQIIGRCTKQGRKTILSVLSQFVPKKLAAVVIHETGITTAKSSGQISKREAKDLAEKMQDLSMTVTRPRPFSEAMVTAGGVEVAEINPKTMESKLVRGLYFAGEVLDIDGLTGGYNLQAAFSTGYVAGTAAATRF